MWVAIEIWVAGSLHQIWTERLVCELSALRQVGVRQVEWGKGRKDGWFEESGKGKDTFIARSLWQERVWNLESIPGISDGLQPRTRDPLISIFIFSMISPDFGRVWSSFSFLRSFSWMWSLTKGFHFHPWIMTGSMIILFHILKFFWYQDYGMCGKPTLLAPIFSILFFLLDFYLLISFSNPLEISTCCEVFPSFVHLLPVNHLFLLSDHLSSIAFVLDTR